MGHCHWPTSKMFHFRFTLAPLHIIITVEQCSDFHVLIIHFIMVIWNWAFNFFFSSLIFTWPRFECYTQNRLAFYEDVSIDGPIDMVIFGTKANEGKKN